MPRHRFSIVIPTRDREKTLGATLQTCLAQEFDDYEIVVSDNSTTGATRELIDRLASPKIKYVRPPVPLAMTDNWNFAIRQASGEFVTVLGSDDGLLLHALPEMDRIIRMLDVRMLRWDPVCYNWPDLPVQDRVAPNDLLIPLKQAGHYLPVRRRSSKEMMLSVVASQMSYAELPMIYCTAIHHELIEELQKRTGSLLKSGYPDIYSGFAFAYLCDHYYSLDAPMSINALSGGSNGVACLFLKEQSQISEDFKALNTRADHVAHKWIPKLPVLSALVADSFMHAKQALFADDGTLVFDRRQLADNSLRELHAANEAEWQAGLRAVRDSMADDEDLKTWFEGEHGGVKHASFNQEAQDRLKRYGQNHLFLDASEFGVTDVVGAAQLCEKLLGFQRDGVNAHLSINSPQNEHQDSPSPPQAGIALSTIQRQQQELEEKEAVIQALSSACDDRSAKIEHLKQKLEQKRAKELELRAKIEKLKTQPR